MLGKLLKYCFIAFCTLAVIGHFAEKSETNTSTSSSSTPAKTYPSNSEGYVQTNDAVGCNSKFSDDKRDDIFKRDYRNHWMTWTGEIVLAESGEVSLDVDGTGIQDLTVDFKDPKAGYDLTIGDTITVKFLMKSRGGCFLAFGGAEAIIL